VRLWAWAWCSTTFDSRAPSAESATGSGTCCNFEVLLKNFFSQKRLEEHGHWWQDRDTVCLSVQERACRHVDDARHINLKSSGQSEAKAKFTRKLQIFLQSPAPKSRPRPAPVTDMPPKARQ